MKRVGHGFAVLAVIAVLAAPAAGQVSVSAQVDTDKDVYVGDNFGYYIIIAGSDKAGQVDLGPLRPYNPRSTGDQKRTSTNIIGSKVTTVTTTIMTYALTINQAGRVQLPSVSVVVDGKTYHTKPVTVNVVEPGTTSQLDIEVELSEQHCFVGQPVLLSIKFYFSESSKDYRFNIPVLRSDAFYFENPDVLDQQVQEVDLGDGTTVIVSRHKVVHGGRETNMYLLRKILIPKSSGPIRIDSIAVNADVPVARSNSFLGPQYRYKRFMVKSDPLDLSVKPLPNEGKPAEFYGLVGRYTIEASATPVQVNVGDPITLNIRVGGGEYLKPVRWPDLEQVPELMANFKIPSQRASPTVSDGFKVFTQTIRANNDKVTEIPSIPLAYFDAETGKYVIAHTKPIKLDVAPTKILTSADMEGADFVPVNREVEAIKKGLSANYEDLGILKDMGFSPVAALANPTYAAIWAVPLLAFVSSALFKLSTRTSSEKVAGRRRRRACGKATGQLKKVVSEDRNRQSELLVSIMKQYIGDRFDRTAGSLTPDDCYDAIAAATQDQQTAEKYRDTIAGFEAGRYAPMSIEITPEKIGEVAKLVQTVEKKCGR